MMGPDDRVGDSLSWCSRGTLSIGVDKRKLLARIINNPRSVRFADAIAMAEAFGFHLSRVGGSHHLFAHPGIVELVNLQEVGGQAKPYQVRQFLKIVERYNLQLGDDE